MNPLDDVLEWYQFIKDSQDVSLRLIKLHSESVPKDSRFAGKTLAEARTLLEQASAEVDDLVIISLAAVFEQKILDHLIDVANMMRISQQGVFPLEVLKYGLDKLERWYFPDVLDFFKTLVHVDIIGQAKQIYQYRNYVAHGKKGIKPASTDLIKAYERLTKFLEQAGLLSI